MGMECLVSVMAATAIAAMHCSVPVVVKSTLDATAAHCGLNVARWL